MSSNSDLFDRRRAQTAIAFSPILEADAPAILEGALCIDYSFIFEARETRIKFPVHKLIGKYTEYGRLFRSKN